ncbi:hypothetical protein TCON_0758 [Astathelohania contejeani]|uniref:Uncharacterized protein n=1 Tax=Astathelohania contejeani TaxID=164912 RepID=A0ABQ7I0S5_9MICR|nr:hypothetical protein TCON_0758 [Thelohania contejeani]
MEKTREIIIEHVKEVHNCPRIINWYSSFDYEKYYKPEIQEIFSTIKSNYPEYHSLLATAVNLIYINQRMISMPNNQSMDIITHFTFLNSINYILDKEMKELKREMLDLFDRVNFMINSVSEEEIINFYILVYLPTNIFILLNDMALDEKTDKISNREVFNQIPDEFKEEFSYYDNKKYEILKSVLNIIFK